MNNMEDIIIRNGVRNLKEFGYPSVNKENILTDEIYSGFFLQMLKDNLGMNGLADEVIENLIKRIEDQ